jgi:hypothetical protein
MTDGKYDKNMNENKTRYAWTTMLYILRFSRATRKGPAASKRVASATVPMWLRLRITPPGPTATATSAPAGRGGPASAVATRVRANASVEEVLDRLRRAPGPDRQGVQGTRLNIEPP